MFSFIFVALIAMIFVNYGGGGYAQFQHSSWHGITIADAVFPLFVWILGASSVFSIKNAFDKGVSKRTLLMKVAMRTLKLFVSFPLHTNAFFILDWAYLDHCLCFEYSL